MQETTKQFIEDKLGMVVPASITEADKTNILRALNEFKDQMRNIRASPAIFVKLDECLQEIAHLSLEAPVEPSDLEPEVDEPIDIPADASADVVDGKLKIAATRKKVQELKEKVTELKEGKAALEQQIEAPTVEGDPVVSSTDTATGSSSVSTTVDVEDPNSFVCYECKNEYGREQDLKSHATRSGHQIYP